MAPATLVETVLGTSFGAISLERVRDACQNFTSEDIVKCLRELTDQDQSILDQVEEAYLMSDSEIEELQRQYSRIILLKAALFKLVGC